MPNRSKYPWEIANEIMLRAGFDATKMRLAQIWECRNRECPKCKAPPLTACRNLNGIRNYGFEGAKENAYPHAERIDYNRLIATLNERGYE